MMIAYAHFLLMLIFINVNTTLFYVVLLAELSNSPLTPATFSRRSKLESLLGNGIDLAKSNRSLGDWRNLCIVY